MSNLEVDTVSGPGSSPRPPRSRRGSDLSDKVAMFNKKCADHCAKQWSNPFSDVDRPEGYQTTKLDVNDPNYGRCEGSRIVSLSTL